MSLIDRRAFVVGCLAVPLAGCNNSVVDRSVGPPAARLAGPPQVHFVNLGNWVNGGNANGDEWVYVVTAGFES